MNRDQIRAWLRTGPVKMRAAYTQPREVPMSNEYAQSINEVVRQAVDDMRNRRYPDRSTWPWGAGRYHHRASRIRSNNITAYLDHVAMWERYQARGKRHDTP